MILEMTGVHVDRGERPVLRGLDLAAPAGAVVGLLGPNGAGKSTTIRTILGLERARSGSVSLFGEPWARSSLRRIGASVDGPSYYGHLTGRQNLQAHAALTGRGAAEITAAVEQAGLAEHADRRAKHYSTGMKSRLATAVAILGDPELVILDEPQNGLDPAGIRDMRRLMRRIADEGRTVLFSSHVLSEVVAVTDRVLCLGDGRLIFAGETSMFANSTDLESTYFSLLQEGE